MCEPREIVNVKVNGIGKHRKSIGGRRGDKSQPLGARGNEGYCGNKSYDVCGSAGLIRVGPVDRKAWSIGKCPMREVGA